MGMRGVRAGVSGGSDAVMSKGRGVREWYCGRSCNVTNDRRFFFRSSPLPSTLQIPERLARKERKRACLTFQRLPLPKRKRSRNLLLPLISTLSSPSTSSSSLASPGLCLLATSYIRSIVLSPTQLPAHACGFAILERPARVPNERRPGGREETGRRKRGRKERLEREGGVCGRKGRSVRFSREGGKEQERKEKTHLYRQLRERPIRSSPVGSSVTSVPPCLDVHFPVPVLKENDAEGVGV